jgi:hypothetical protein
MTDKAETIESLAAKLAAAKAQKKADRQNAREAKAIAAAEARASDPGPERIIFQLPADLRDRIATYRYANRLPTESAALRQLLELGLARQAPELPGDRL